jgi:hypothetical protein
MGGAIPPLPQYTFMAWWSFKKTQGQLYLVPELSIKASECIKIATIK